MRFFYLAFIMVIANTGISQNEVPVSSFKNNTLRLDYSSFYFFDNLKPSISDYSVNFGLLYRRFNLTNKRGFHFGIHNHAYYGDVPNPIYIGEVFSREVIFVSVGMDQRLIEKKNFRLLWFGELNNKFGGETFYGGGVGTTWANVPRKVLDFGLSIGTEFSYRFPFGLLISTGLKQAFYYYRLDTGVPSWSHDKGSSRNVLNFSFGLGWNF